ncbi:hypothetical protein SAMN05428945_4600 [Streptomyces sp. 2224.1]|uniref:hypothetical protein n=1 Tax=Streptomyces sp. 2224.1 TaxID=1881020 RepID=UPI000896BE56|nr:hypothetical protein [Streptomyces sp. 2224.1]SED33718.1 hypothetical protein SAMN05428945_4600 [Streptomyces sp. 2224.1]
MLDTTALLDQIVPAAEAAAAAYGVSVLTRTQDAAANATVRLGQRLIHRLLHHDADTAPDSAPVRTAVVRLAEAGADPEMLALHRAELRLALRTALTEAPGLAAELSALLPAPPPPPVVHAEGERSVAVGGDNSGTISTGDGAGGAPRR